MPRHTLALEDLSQEEEDELNLAMELSRRASLRRSKSVPSQLEPPKPNFLIPNQAPRELYDRNAPPSPFIYHSPRTAAGQRTPSKSVGGSVIMIRPKEQMMVAPYTIEMSNPQIQYVPVPVYSRSPGICAIICFFFGVLIFVSILLHFFIFKFTFDDRHEIGQHHGGNHGPGDMGPNMNSIPPLNGAGVGSQFALFGNNTSG